MLMNLFERPAQSKKREGIRELSADEMIYIGGGDDPGDSSTDGGDPSDSPDTGMSQTDAQNLVSNIDLAFNNPAIALGLLAATLANGLPGMNPNAGVSSNPMGDPSPGSSGDGP